MRRIPWPLIPAAVILALLIAAVARGVELVGPLGNEDLSKPVPVGRYVRISVEGVQPEVVSEEGLIHYPRDGTDLIPARTWGGQPFLLFLGDRPGKYLVALVVATQQNTWGDAGPTLQRAEVEITVGPPPDPPVPPVPPGAIGVVVVVESKDRTPEQAAVLLELRTWLLDQGIPHRFADPDLIDSQTQQTPQWLQPCLTAAAEVTPPVLEIVTLSEDAEDFSSGVLGVLHAETLPATSAAAIKVIEEVRHGRS